MAPPSLIGSRTSMIRGNEFSNEIRALRLQPRMKKEISRLRAPQVSIRPTREGSRVMSEPRLTSTCGRPLSIAIGMGGSVRQGVEVWAKNVLVSIK